jgi:hypothetical protein
VRVLALYKSVVVLAHLAFVASVTVGYIGRLYRGAEGDDPQATMPLDDDDVTYVGGGGRSSYGSGGGYSGGK